MYPAELAVDEDFRHAAVPLRQPHAVAARGLRKSSSADSHGPGIHRQALLVPRAKRQRFRRGNGEARREPASGRNRPTRRPPPIRDTIVNGAALMVTSFSPVGGGGDVDPAERLVEPPRPCAAVTGWPLHGDRYRSGRSMTIQRLGHLPFDRETIGRRKAAVGGELVAYQLVARTARLGPRDCGQAVLLKRELRPR